MIETRNATKAAIPEDTSAAPPCRSRQGGAAVQPNQPNHVRGEVRRVRHDHQHDGHPAMYSTSTSAMGPTILDTAHALVVVEVEMSKEHV